MRKRLSIRAMLCMTGLSILFAATPCLLASAAEVLPPEAQEAVSRGLAAARQQDWALAVRYFTEARKAASAAPQVIFNLALACDKAGGRDLPAIALYRACLASTPVMTNAEQIRARVLELEVRAESDTIRLLQKTREMHNLLKQQGVVYPGGSAFHREAGQVSKYLGRFAEAETEFLLIDEQDIRKGENEKLLEARIKGYDLDGALKSLSSPHGTPYSLQLYSCLVKTGRLEQLRQLAERISDETEKAKAYHYLFSARLGAGDPKGAAELIEKIPSESRQDGYKSLSEKLREAGDFTGAMDAAAKAQEKFRVWLMLEAVKEQAKKGDASGAALNIKKCMTMAERVRNEAEPLDGLLRIASVQIDLGMKGDALETVRKALAAAKTSDSDLGRICEVQAWAGDVEGARKTAGMSSAAGYRLSAHLHIANAQAFAGDKAGARETLSRIESLFPKDPSSDVYTYYVALALGAAEDDVGLKRFLTGKPQGYTPEIAKAMPYFELFFRRTELHDRAAARRCLDRALAIASECSEAYSGCRIYNFVFWKLVESGENAGASEILQRIAALLPRISDPKERDITYRSVSSLKLRLDDFNGAVEAASFITDEKVREAAFKTLFENRIKGRDIQGAMEFARQISSLYEKRQVCYALSGLMASLGRYRESRAMEALPNMLMNTKTYSDLDEPKSWLTLADKYLGNPALADLKGYIEGLKGRNPGDQASGTMKGAWEIAYALQGLRDEAGKWDAYHAVRSNTR